MFNQIRDFLICLILFVAVLYPDQVGYWKAQFDISYESIMNEYYADCDCGEWLK